MFVPTRKPAYFGLSEADAPYYIRVVWVGQKPEIVFTVRPDLAEFGERQGWQEMPLAVAMEEGVFKYAEMDPLSYCSFRLDLDPSHPNYVSRILPEAFAELSEYGFPGDREKVSFDYDWSWSRDGERSIGRPLEIMLSPRFDTWLRTTGEDQPLKQLIIKRVTAAMRQMAAFVTERSTDDPFLEINQMRWGEGWLPCFTCRGDAASMVFDDHPMCTRADQRSAFIAHNIDYLNQMLVILAGACELEACFTEDLPGAVAS